ncbi:MAG: histone deacetylase [Thermoplasmata archaeon]|nr:histone deacetylase [Thermoplasmata archaeon]
MIYHESFVEHEQWPGHPERPERLMAIKEALEAHGLWKGPVPIEPVPRELLAHIHQPSYIERLKNTGPGFLDADTAWADSTFDTAMRALGGAYTGVRKTLTTGQPSLCLLRPPGHHAGPDYFGGFCYFNNAALAAETARHEGVERVAIVDIDVHHGNGTRDIMAARRDILYLSTHQWGIYPGTGPNDDVGEDEGEGYTVNLALPSGSGDSTYSDAFDKVAEPILDDHKPGFIVVSIGMDAHYMDPLATLSLSTPGYLSLCQRLVDMAKERCSGKIVFVLEGGYDLGALGDVGVGLAAMLSEKEMPSVKYDMIRDDSVRGADGVASTIHAQKEYWSL